MATDDDTIPEGGATVREGGSGSPPGGATVREGGSGSPPGGATVREGRTGSPPGGATVREGQGAPPPSPPPAQEEAPGWLPPALAANWRRIKPLPARGAEADLYVVGPRDPSLDAGADARRVIKVYREDINPKAEVLELVKGADPSHVVWLEDYGEDQGRWWERMEYAEQGSLRQLLEREGPKLPDDLVLEILRQLNDALAALHALPLEHRDLKPGNVLVRSRDPLDVILTDFGIATLMAQSRRHTDTARTIRYAPPESLGRKVVIEKTALDYWSLGMMLVEMLRGEHPFEGLEEAVIVTELATQNVDDLTEGVEDPDWRKLCRGLLRRAPADRWGAADVSRWIEDSKDPGLEVAEEAAPARPTAAAPSTAAIDFDGASYGTPAELGAALARDWSKADSFWKRRLEDVRTWVTDGLGLQPLGDAMAGIDDSDLPLEAQVFSFVYLLAPEAPLRFRDADISMEGLAALGARAANQGTPRRATSFSCCTGRRSRCWPASCPAGRSTRRSRAAGTRPSASMNASVRSSPRRDTWRCPNWTTTGSWSCWREPFRAPPSWPASGSRRAGPPRGARAGAPGSGNWGSPGRCRSPCWPSFPVCRGGRSARRENTECGPSAAAWGALSWAVCSGGGSGGWTGSEEDSISTISETSSASWEA